MIFFQGWADPIVPIGQTVDFYKGLDEQVRRRREDERVCPARSWCPAWAIAASVRARTGSTRPLSAERSRQRLDPEHDIFTALSHWVEDGVAPAQVIATKFVDDDASKGIEMQRPLCPYPQRAWYRGDGDANSAANFVCSVDKK